MTVIGIGDMKVENSEKFCGIIIEATRKELQEVAGDILYREVAVLDKSAAEDANIANNLTDLFVAQIDREVEIKARLHDDVPRMYTREDVLAIMGELLDGVKPKKGSAK